MSRTVVNQFREFVRRYGKRATVRLALAPVTCLVATPWRYWQLWQTCRLAGPRCWKPSQDFDSYKGLLAYAYHTQALVLSRHGRSSQCPYLGQGNYPTSAWWHITWPSLLLYWKSSAMTPLLAIFLWWVSGTVWIGHSPHALVVMLLLACSSSLYGQALLRQNYNALGWMFWPLGLWATLQHHSALAALIWLAASFFSFTSVFCAATVCALFGLINLTPWPLLSVLPALAKLCTHFLSNLVQGNLFERLSSTAKAIGLQKAKAPLAPVQPLGTRALYLIVLYSTFLIMTIQNPAWSLFFSAFLVHLLNFNKRFADEQSLELLLLSCASSLVFYDFSWCQCLGLWLLACPIPLMDLRTRGWSVLDVVPKVELLDFRLLEERLADFLKPVPDGSRVLMTFPDPANVYSSIFDGQHMLKEPLNYLAAQRRIHLSPDFWFVFENNFEGGQNLWGLGPAQALANAQSIAANFVVTYSEKDQPVPSEYIEAGFECLAQFDWAANSEFCPFQRWPNWWLLQVPRQSERSGSSSFKP